MYIYIYRYLYIYMYIYTYEYSYIRNRISKRRFMNIDIDIWIDMTHPFGFHLNALNVHHCRATVVAARHGIEAMEPCWPTLWECLAEPGWCSLNGNMSGLSVKHALDHLLPLQKCSSTTTESSRVKHAVDHLENETMMGLKHRNMGLQSRIGYSTCDCTFYHPKVRRIDL